MSDEINARQVWRGRLQLLAIIAIVVVPVWVSYFVFYTGIGVPTDTVNNGILVEPPVDIGAALFTNDSGQNWSIKDQGPVFKLLQFIDGDCAEFCQELLYTARQVHTRLGKEAHQLLRLVIHTGDISPETRALLSEEYPKAILLKGEYEQWRAFLPDANPLNNERLYLVDRHGFLVMYYTPAQSGGELLKDLNHLIKTAQ